VRVRAQTLELYQGAVPVLTLPRLCGRHRIRIDYRHVIWSLVRKPGAFMAYKYREEIPEPHVSGAFDTLSASVPEKATPQYLKLSRFDPTIRTQIERLKSGAFLNEAINVVAVGKPGSGKNPSCLGSNP
jgi:hypothetical protein